jgi:hypothetical protein
MNVTVNLPLGTIQYKKPKSHRGILFPNTYSSSAEAIKLLSMPAICLPPFERPANVQYTKHFNGNFVLHTEHLAPKYASNPPFCSTR